MEKRWKDGGIYNVEYDCEEIEDDIDGNNEYCVVLEERDGYVFAYSFTQIGNHRKSNLLDVLSACIAYETDGFWYANISVQPFVGIDGYMGNIPKNILETLLEQLHKKEWYIDMTKTR